MVIARAGKPVARLTALKQEKRGIVFGLLEGEGAGSRTISMRLFRTKYWPDLKEGDTNSLDTHIVYWNYYKAKRMPEMARQIIIDAEARFVSSASIWEIAIKCRLGKMNANPRRIVERIEAAEVSRASGSNQTRRTCGRPAALSQRSFDRILIAQAMSEPLHLLTADPQLRQYSELVIQV